MFTDLVWTCMNVYKYVSLSNTEIVASQSFPPTHRGVDVNACSCICQKTLRVANTTNYSDQHPKHEAFLCCTVSYGDAMVRLYQRVSYSLIHPSVDSTKSAVDLHLVPALVAVSKCVNHVLVGIFQAYITIHNLYLGWFQLSDVSGWVLFMVPVPCSSDCKATQLQGRLTTIDSEMAQKSPLVAG